MTSENRVNWQHTIAESKSVGNGSVTQLPQRDLFAYIDFLHNEHEVLNSFNMAGNLPELVQLLKASLDPMTNKQGEQSFNFH